MKMVVAIAGSILLCLQGCGVKALWEAMPRSEKATTRLLVAIGEAGYVTVREHLTVEMAERYSLDNVADTFGPIRNAVGVCGPPVTTRSNTNVNAAGTTVVLQVSAHCASAELRANLVWKIEAGEPRLSGFSFQQVIASSDGG